MKTAILTLSFLLLFFTIPVTKQAQAQMVESILSSGQINVSPDEAKALNISAEQLKSMQAADSKHTKEMMKLRHQIMDDTTKLQEEMRLPNPNKNNIKAIADQINMTQKKINDAQIEYYFSSRSLFKSEQLQALAKRRVEQNKKMEAEMKKRIEEMRAKMPVNKNIPQAPKAVNK